MAEASTIPSGKIAKLPAFNPRKETVTTLRKRVEQFRNNWSRLPVTNKIESCCFVPSAFSDFLRSSHAHIPLKKWNWKLTSSCCLDMDNAWIRPTLLEFWDIEKSDNMGATYCLRFLDCKKDQLLQIQIGSPAKINGGGSVFRDGDLCYIIEDQQSQLCIYELFFLTTIHGKSGWVTRGTHKWLPHDVNDWQATLNSLVGIYYFHEQPGSEKFYHT